MSDGEYEVESILRAKLVGLKRGKRSWSYWVKWKGYGLGDNTWEPATSFKGGSEHFIDRFWDRIDTQGRDYGNLREFAIGEEFFPLGPPRKKAKQAKEREESPPPPAEAPIEISDSEPEAPPPRAASSKKGKKKAKDREESPPPPVQVLDSEREVHMIVNDELEEPSASAAVSTRSKRGRSPAGEEDEPAQPKGKRGRPLIVYDEIEKPSTNAVSTRSKRGSSPVGREDEPPRPKGKRGRPPGKRPSELQAELLQLELEPVIVDEPPPPPKRKRGRPPGIPAHEMPQQAQAEPAVVVNEPVPRPAKRKRGLLGKLLAEPEAEEKVATEAEEAEAVIDEPAPPPAKRKRGHPPGKRPAEVEAEERLAAEAEPSASAARATSPKRKKLTTTKPHNAERIVPDSRDESSRGRKPPAAEPTTSIARRLSLPRRRKLTPKVVPPSRSPSADELLIVPESVSSKGNGKTSRSKKAGTSAEDAMDVDALPEPSEPAEPQSTFGAPALLGPDPSLEAMPEDAPAPSLPAHRLRAANPRVQVMDDPYLTEVNGPDAIPVKARFMKRAINGGDKASGSSSRPPRVSGSKAGPGKSSAGLPPEVNSTRLTAQKGALTSVKPRKARKSAAQPVERNSDAVDGTIVDSADILEAPGLEHLDVEPEPVPTGQELLEAAGMNDKAAEDLPDFEDGVDNAEPSAQEAQDEVMEVEPPRAFDNLSSAAVQPPEAHAVQAKPVTFASRVSAWNSTIFGPLALGFTGRAQSENGAADASPEAKRYTFHLNLDPAVSVPIALKDVHASQAFLNGLDATARNPTGKFYKDGYAVALVDSFKAKESFARVVQEETATDEQKPYFERFITRLQDGELFIQMNRAETLVMCSSDNSVLGQKLGFPPQLLGLGGTAIVAHVDIENYSQYAEAAVHADSTRW